MDSLKIVRLTPLPLLLLGALLASCSHSASSITTLDTSKSSNTETLKIGFLSPETGSLDNFFPETVQTVRLAEKEINDAGGNISIQTADSGTDPDIATNSVSRLLDDGVHAIVGPYSSYAALGVVDQIIGENVIMMSPSASTVKFTDYDDNGLLFRTVTSNILWGQAIAKEIIDDGNKKVGIIYRDEAFGTELAQGTKKNLEAENINVALFMPYDVNSPMPDQIAEQVKANNLDALFLAPFNEGIDIIRSLINLGIRPPAVKIYLSVLEPSDLGERISPDNPGVIEGFKRIDNTPHPSSDTTFYNRLKAANPDAKDLTYLPTTYDAIIILALASLIANSVDSKTVAKAINDVTRDGTKCNRYAECAQLVKNGENIDYDGASGPLEFVDAGEPNTASFLISSFDSQGVLNKGRVVLYP